MVHSEKVGKVKGAEPSQASTVSAEPTESKRSTLRHVSACGASALASRVSGARHGLNAPGAMPLFPEEEAALGGEVHGWLLWHNAGFPSFFLPITKRITSPKPLNRRCIVSKNCFR